MLCFCGDSGHLQKQSGIMSTPPGVETRGRAIEAVCIVAPIIAGIFVSLRVWARLGITKSFGADDCCYPLRPL